MSHELRTPLNAILGFSQLMHYDKRHPLCPEQSESVDEINRPAIICSPSLTRCSI